MKMVMQVCAAIPVAMAVRVDKTGATQQFVVAKNFGGGTLGDYFPVLHNHADICHVFDDIQVVGGHYQSLVATAPIDQGLDEPTFAFRVQ